MIRTFIEELRRYRRSSDKLQLAKKFLNQCIEGDLLQTQALIIDFNSLFNNVQSSVVKKLHKVFDDDMSLFDFSGPSFNETIDHIETFFAKYIFDSVSGWNYYLD